MPTGSTASPVKRPALGRRAVSSHAVVTRSSTNSDLSDTSSNTSHNKRSHHRPHIVGGGHHHRAHHRNPSGKNLNKLQRHLSALTISTEAGGRYNHQRKKSAPVTPVASPPKASHHVRWDGAVDDQDSQHTRASMKKNYSSPALRRNSSSVLGKKALVTNRPQSSGGKKKTVGFELGDSDNDNDDGEWEDTTQSPESTRRSSVAQSKDSVDNNTAVLIDPLTFVKRPYPQFPRATSLPESTIKGFGQVHDSDESDQDDHHETHDNGHDHDNSDKDNDDIGRPPPSPLPLDDQQTATRAQDHGDIASRLLSPSHSAKAPPAMSSISALAEPTMVDTVSRTTSLTNLNVASTHDAPRRPTSSSNVTLANTPGISHATSSSIEGGVSRFIKAGLPSTSRTDSDPNTPSSFLPHYHPQTPPSPNRASGSRKSRGSPPSRPSGAEPHSRTQQKLWLQRTAALNTSPPDSHGTSTSASPSAMDATSIAAQARPGPAAFDTGRSLVNGTSRPGAAVHDTETKQVRKAYEKTALELTVVRRFQSPTADSFQRLNTMVNGNRSTNLAASSQERPGSSLGKPVKSAPALTDLSADKPTRQNSASPDARQLLSRKQSNIHPSASQSYLQDPDDLDPATSTELPHRPKGQHPSHRILSTSDEAAHPSAEEEAHRAALISADESAMMIRRMWESREVATSG